MTMSLPPLRLTGATILRDRVLQDRTVAIADGRICKGPYPAVDLSGYYILPGIIDLHGDAFERHLAPRPSAPFPIEAALTGTDRDAAANGVTTAWMALSWSWEGGLRGPDQAENVMHELERMRPQLSTDLRIQIRYETHAHDTEDRLLQLVRRHGIDYVVFNNHIDEAFDLLNRRPEDVRDWAKRSQRSVEQFLDLIREIKRRKDQVPRRLCRLAEAFDVLGVRYGSHDDSDGETREYFSMLGARICEFPTSAQAASVARAVGDPVILGAPNVVRGGSQAGNVSAESLIRAGKCNALVSDYYYPALPRAAFSLVDRGALDLPRAWALVSEGPASILGLTDRGIIARGKRADLVVMNKETQMIEATISGGRISHMSGPVAGRFFGSAAEVSMAAE